MFCPKCGAQNLDESMFCVQCGLAFSEQSQPVQSVQQELPLQSVQTDQPMQSEQAEQQSVQPVLNDLPIPGALGQQSSQPNTYGQQTAVQQPFSQPFRQPQQPQQFAGQPMYAPQPNPQQAKVRAPISPQKKKAIIIASACTAVLAAFLIVLFAAIIPNSGFKGKLRHVWSCQQSRMSTIVIDLKAKTVTDGDEISVITNWAVKGNHFILSSRRNFQVYTEDFICALTPDGRTLYLFEADGYTIKDDPDYVFTRID